MPKKIIQQAAEREEDARFERVWAILEKVAQNQVETDRIVKELSKETAEWRKEADRIVKEVAEQSKETDRVVKEFIEQSKETDRVVKEFIEQSKETDRVVKEYSKEAAESRKETDRIVKELSKEAAEWRKEADRIVKETAEQSKETDRIVKEFIEQSKANREELAQLERMVKTVSGNVGGLNRSFGELIETLLTAHLWEKFPQYGFTHALQRIPIYDAKHQVKSDVDILLANTNVCMAVEVKRELNKMGSVDEHLKRLQLIRQYLPKLVDNSRLFGAMAGGVVDPAVKEYAHKSGLFVIELSDDTVRLCPLPENFVPQEW